jgi:DNA-directed RNA polymerase subunit RPC12/RpoP
MSTEQSDAKWAPMTTSRQTAAPKCITCGNQVTRQFARVFGDNRDVVHACPDCSTYREMKTSDYIPKEAR